MKKRVIKSEKGPVSEVEEVEENMGNCCRSTSLSQYVKRQADPKIKMKTS